MQCSGSHGISVVFSLLTEYTEGLKTSKSDPVSLPSQAVCDKDSMASASVGMADLSDEILLCILRHVPVCDLLMNVSQVCHKLQTLCYDKALLSRVSFSEEYTVKLLITFELPIHFKYISSTAQTL